MWDRDASPYQLFVKQVYVQDILYHAKIMRKNVTTVTVIHIRTLKST